MGAKKHIESKDVLQMDGKAFNKLVNIIIYIKKLESKNLNLTRLLKFLYIIDEKSILKIGTPVTNLEYKVAENGPLADHLWKSVLNHPEVFAKYFDIKITKTIRDQQENTTCCISKSHELVDLKILSKFEDKLIKETVQKYKGVTTEDIIEELHGEDTLWGKMMKKYNLDFEESKSAISAHKINFHDLIKDDEMKSDSYENYLSRKV
jgi:hypothetical protein